MDENNEGETSRPHNEEKDVSELSVRAKRKLFLAAMNENAQASKPLDEGRKIGRKISFKAKSPPSPSPPPPKPKPRPRHQKEESQDHNWHERTKAQEKGNSESEHTSHAGKETETISQSGTDRETKEADVHSPGNAEHEHTLHIGKENETIRQSGKDRVDIEEAVAFENPTSLSIDVHKPVNAENEKDLESAVKPISTSNENVPADPIEQKKHELDSQIKPLSTSNENIRENTSEDFGDNPVAQENTSASAKSTLEDHAFQSTGEEDEIINDVLETNGKKEESIDESLLQKEQELVSHIKPSSTRKENYPGNTTEESRNTPTGQENTSTSSESILEDRVFRTTRDEDELINVLETNDKTKGSHDESLLESRNTPTGQENTSTSSESILEDRVFRTNRDEDELINVLETNDKTKGSHDESLLEDITDDESEWLNIPDAEEEEDESNLGDDITEDNDSASKSNENIESKESTGFSDLANQCNIPENTQDAVHLRKNAPRLMDYERSSDIVHSIMIEINKSSITTKSVQLSWPDRHLQKDEWFVVYFKEEGTIRWISNDRYLKDNQTIVDNLEPNKTYQFRVKIKNDLEDSTTNYSEVSDPITTQLSQVQEWTKRSKKAKHSDNIWILPAMELLSARDERRMTRKLVLTDGKQTNAYPERTILVLGATGSGKSTWIDSMANYLLDAECEGDRFQIVCLEANEKQKEADPTKSLTEWITCYTIIPNAATEGRLNFTLNILDTPGIGDTRGIIRDEEIITQIEKLFQKEGEGSIKTIDAICFVFPAPQTRLTASQRYVCETMVALFGKDVAPNVVTITTFFDGQKPNVLKTLEVLKIPYKPWFAFNNGGLFQDTSNEEDKDMLRHHWKRNTANFKQFFDAIEHMEPKTLLLTVDVLKKRRKLQHTQDALRDQIKEALNAVWALEQEINIFLQNKTEIEKNKNFKYSIEDVVLEKRTLPPNATYQATNCKECNYTCHLECPKNKKTLNSCISMDREGYCMSCPMYCHYSKHTKSNVVLVRNQKKVEKTFKGKISEYNVSIQPEKGTEEVIKELKERVENYEKRIAVLASLLQDYDAELQEKALRHNPTDVADYFDQLIKAESTERKKGYRERIQALENCKKRMDINADIKEFFDRAKLAGQKLHEAYQQKEGRSLIGHVGNFISKLWKK